MSISKQDGRIVQKMAKEGHSIQDICAALKNKHTYEDVQAYMWENGTISLQGAKKAIGCGSFATAENRLRSIT